MSHEQRSHPGADMQGFVRDMMEFVGMNDADVASIRRTAPLVLQHERAIADALYQHFLRFPATARFFLAPDGSPDQSRLERRKHTLTRWLRESAEVAMTHDFTYYLLAIGLSHSHRAHGPGGKVPPHFLVSTMSLAQTTLATLFQAHLGSVEEAFAASLAWNKLLLIHLNVFLLGYFLPATS